MSVLDVIDFDGQTARRRSGQADRSPRQGPRKPRIFALADTLRDELLALGVRVTDSSAGTSWKKTRSS